MRALGLALITFVLASVSIHVSRDPNSLAYVWLPNATAAVALMRSDPRVRSRLVVGFAVGVFAANWAYGDPLILCLGLSLANLTEVLVGVWFALRSGPVLEQGVGLRQGLWLLLCLAVAGPLVGGIIGASVVHALLGGSLWQIFVGWWTSAAAGALFLGPLAIAPLPQPRISSLPRHEVLRALGMLVMASSLAVLLLMMLPFPFVFMAGLFGVMSFRYGPAVGSITALATYTLFGLVIFAGHVPVPPHVNQHGAQAFWVGGVGSLIFPYVMGLLAEQLRADKRQLAEQIAAARAARQDFERLFSLMPDAALIIDSALTVLKANRAAHTLFRYREGALEGGSILSLADPGEVPMTLDDPAIQPLPLIEGQSQYRSVVRARRADGTLFFAESHFAELTWAGKVVSLDIVRDITAQQELQQAVEEARARAEEGARQKGEFLANMSHELRTPMNAVLGAAQLLEGTHLSTAQRTYVEIILGSGRSLLGILNDVLDFTRLEVGRMQLAPQEMRLDDVLRGVAPIMSFGAADKELEVVLDLSPELPDVVVGDPLRLQQVVVNLVGNAVKFTSAGQVVLTVSGRERGEGRLTVAFEVQDTGIGMTQAELDRLFLAFSQAESSMTRRFGGSGLGLVISRRLAELMGGTIDVRSEAGVGSVFTFTVPLALPGGAPARSRQEPLLAGRRVLLIVANARTRESLSRWLGAWGCRGVAVSSLAEAVERLGGALDGESSLDLVVADLDLPGAGGLDVLRACKGQGRRLPLVLLSSPQGRVRLSEVNDGVEADAVLHKPVIPEALLEASRRLVGAPESAGDTSSGASATGALPLRGIRVLLAEDNLLNRTVATSLLRRAGAEVEAVDDGRAAVRTLQEGGDSFDIVLMDVQMPGLDGFGATRIIRQELGLNLPVIAMSAGVLPSERRRCEEAGMNDFVAKPIELQDLIQAVSRHALRRAPEPPAIDASAPPAAPVLDLARVLAVGGDDAGYRNAVAGIVRGVVESGMAPLEEADQAWADGKPEAAGRVYHRLRGFFGTLGAAGLSARCGLAEDLIHQGKIEEARALRLELATDLRAVVGACAAWLSQQGP